MYVDANLPALLQNNSNASTMNTNNDNNKGHDGKNTTNKMDKDSKIKESQSTKKTCKNETEDATAYDKKVSGDKIEVNTKSDDVLYNNINGSVMLTIPVNIPS